MTQNFYKKVKVTNLKFSIKAFLTTNLVTRIFTE